MQLKALFLQTDAHQQGHQRLHVMGFALQLVITKSNKHALLIQDEGSMHLCTRKQRLASFTLRRLRWMYEQHGIGNTPLFKVIACVSDAWQSPRDVCSCKARWCLAMASCPFLHDVCVTKYFFARAGSSTG